MRAIQVTSLDGPKAVQLVDLPPPDSPGQVVVEVHAVGVNFPDVLQTRGEYQMKVPLPFVPGGEVAGTVVSGPGFEPGQRVAGFCGWGGFAEQVAVDPSMVFPLPDSLTFPQGAALPMNYLTVDFALQHRTRLEPGETILVQGAAGGIGVATTQFAKALGARVIAVVSTPDKEATARAAGADEVVVGTDFKATVKELTGGRGVDCVMDPVGGDRFTDSLRCLAQQGRLLVVGFTAGIPEVKVNRLLLNNISVIGVAWGEYFLSHPGYMQQQWQRLLPHLESGALVPLVGSTFPLEDAAQALLELDERRAQAKVVITPR
ncbi:MAG TPA: NADPH:quinone oxidoreductase family protein [Mycobacteriales bacterium]|nr:NADPH:quinone oxidoreductase family protein [Mycobacteriales bacterium]